MKNTKSTIAKLLTKSNALAPVLITAICLLFPVIAFSQTFRVVGFSGRSQSQALTNSGQISQTFTITNLNDSSAGNLRQTILAANRNADLNGSPGAAEIAAAQRGNPFINFENGKTLASESVSSANAKPLALASADFDADGTPDLAIAYADENGGFVLIRRGNVESIFPANAGEQPAPFFAESSRFEILLAADHLSAGDFNGDGRADLLAVKNGSNVLIFLAGTGAGDFAAPQAVELKGVVTAFAVGEMNNFDNLADFAVGIIEKGAAKILIFQSSYGAFANEPQSLKVGKTVSALAFGELDAHPSRDLIAASGDELVFVSGSVNGKIEKKNISRQKLDFQIAALAIGDFVGERENEIAVLSEDGGLFLSVPSAVAGGSSRKTQNLNVKDSTISVQPPATAGSTDLLLTAKVSTRQKTDLIIVSNNQLNLVTSDGVNNLSLAASFDVTDNPIGVLPMRLNKDALADLVVITKNKFEPTILMSAPMQILTVSNEGDSGANTLRDAIETANNSPGLDEIQFDLSDPTTPITTQTDLPELSEATTLDATTQAGYNGEPLIEISAAPDVTFTVPMLRFTVEGNSVLRGFVVTTNNYLLNIIQLDGNNNFIESNFIGTNRAGTASGGDALNGVSVGSSGNTIGGATVQARNVISGVAGAESSTGVSVTGNNNRVEGNYIGTDKTGMMAVGSGGVGVYVGSIGDGNVVGGSTISKRNVISGNGVYGVEINPSPGDFSDAVIENNFIGTNKNGDAAIGNGNGGIWLAYSAGNNTPTATVNILDNVISGNIGDGIYANNIPVPGELNAAPNGIITDIPVRRNFPVNASPGDVPSGNRIGVNASGTAALPNTGNGIRLENFPSGLIEGNIISGNGANGIKSVSQPSATQFSQIADNFIGVDASGANDLGNAADGINLEFNGTSPVEVEATKIWDNVISGNNGDGVRIFGDVIFANNVANSAGSNNRPMPRSVSFFASIARQATNLGQQITPGNIPTGNFIGTNAAGTAALPNTGNGVNLQGVPALVEGNLISANGMSGINAKPPITTDLPFEISENFIGTDASGNVDLGNTGDGITLEYNGTAHIDAKTSDILSNVISGNNGDGIRIFGNAIFANNAANSSGSKNNVMPRTTSYFAAIGRQAQGSSKSNLSKKNNVMPRNASFFVNCGRQATNLSQPITIGNLPLGNRIGTDAAGTLPLGNAGHGISITNIPSKIGGETFDEGNIIANNGLAGMAIFSGAGNLIQSNAIFSNVSLGIDLGGDGLTPNDLLDADTGPNNLQNYPVVTSASSNGSLTSVSGTINTTPNTDLKIEFYATSDGSTNFGGSPFGTLAVTSNGMGNASFSATFPVGISSGRFISATATTADTNVGNENNTSEFSPGVLVFAPTSASVTVTGRILSPQGAGVSKAMVSLTAPNGVTRTVLASSLGYYRFEDIPVGETYVFSVSSKRFTFAPRVVFVTEEMTVDFTAEP